MPMMAFRGLRGCEESPLLRLVGFICLFFVFGSTLASAQQGTQHKGTFGAWFPCALVYVMFSTVITMQIGQILPPQQTNGLAYLGGGQL